MQNRDKEWVISAKYYTVQSATKAPKIKQDFIHLTMEKSIKYDTWLSESLSWRNMKPCGLYMDKMY